MDKDKRTIVGAIIICIAILAVWVMIPLLGYIVLQREWKGGSCVVQNYGGHICKGVLGNKRLCVSRKIQYAVESLVTDTLCDWNSNGTQCYQNVKSRVCQFFFRPFEVEDAGSCGERCYDDVNYNGSWNDVPSQELQEGCDGVNYNESTDELNCLRSFYYNATSSLSISKPVVEIRNLFVVSASIGIVGYVLAIVATCFNRSIMFRFPSLLLVYWCIARFIYHSATLLECDYVFGIIPQTVRIFTESLSILLTLFHTITLFSSVWFPIYAQRMLDLCRNRIHCGVVIFSVPVSLIASAFMAVFYPYNAEDIYFYVSLPFYFCSSIIAVLVVLVMSKLITRNQKQFRATCRAECSAEVKLTAILAFNVIFITTTITKYFLFRYQTFKGDIIYDIYCESDGTRSCHLQFNAYAGAIYAFSGFCSFILCLAPCVVLVYVIPVGIIKKYFNIKCLNISSKIRNNTQDMV